MDGFLSFQQLEWTISAASLSVAHTVRMASNTDLMLSVAVDDVNGVVRIAILVMLLPEVFDTLQFILLFFHRFKYNKTENII